MTRREAVIYLMDNPKVKLKMIKDRYGNDLDSENKILRLNSEGDIILKTTWFSIYCEDDKSEFEVIKELKKMSFVEAVNLTRKDRKIIIESEETGNGYTGEIPIYLISECEIQGLWTVEGEVNE